MFSKPLTHQVRTHALSPPHLPFTNTGTYHTFTPNLGSPCAHMQSIHVPNVVHFSGAVREYRSDAELTYLIYLDALVLSLPLSRLSFLLCVVSVANACAQVPSTSTRTTTAVTTSAVFPQTRQQARSNNSRLHHKHLSKHEVLRH